MPFTGAHPSVFLPFLRNKHISSTGLIAGSMAPDFEYFLKMSSGSSHSHTIAGIFYFDLPVTLLIAIIFHQVIKRPLSPQLPTFLRSRNILVTDFSFISYLKTNYLTFLCCAVIGSASHLAWDSLTHNTWVTQAIPIYQMISLRVGKLNYPLFYLLQQISTVAGTLAMIIYILMIPKLKNYAEESRSILKWFWPVVFSSTVAIFTIRFSDLNTWPLLRWNQIPDLGDTVVSLISAFMVSITVSAMFADRVNKHRSSVQ